MMARIAIALLLCLIFPASAFSAITVEQAAEIASEYKDLIESIDMEPQSVVYAMGRAFWVIEILSFGKIITMVPVDSDTGEIDDSDETEEVIKVHYLANFFATRAEIADFLSDTKNLVLGMKTDYETRQDQFVSLWEPQIPENVTLTKKEPYLSALDTSIIRAEGIRTQINSLTPILSDISSSNDVSLVQSTFNSLFSKQQSFIDSLDTLSDVSTELITELNERMQDGEIDQSLASAIIQGITFSGLVQDKNRLQDDLDQNKNEITTFFGGLDDQAVQYLARLQNRTSGSAANELRKQIAEKLSNYTDSYTEISSKSSTIPPEYNNDIQELYDLLIDAQDLYVDADYTAVQVMFDDIEDKIDFLNEKIGTWPPTCTGGKILSGSGCVCPAGTTEENGECVASEGGGGLNWTLIGALLIILAALGYIWKKRSSGEKIEETDESEGGSYVESFKY